MSQSRKMSSDFHVISGKITKIAFFLKSTPTPNCVVVKHLERIGFGTQFPVKVQNPSLPCGVWILFFSQRFGFCRRYEKTTPTWVGGFKLVYPASDISLSLSLSLFLSAFPVAVFLLGRFRQGHVATDPVWHKTSCHR